MKKIILVSCFWLLAGTTAQTNVSGFINANTTWNLAGSPYIVLSNTLLSHGYTLTIDPGVVVKFNYSTALQIDGELIAIGTPASKITFTSNQPTPAAGDWGKVQFSDTCSDAIFDAGGNYLSGSIMKYCDVLYAGGIGFGAIHIDHSSPYLTNCSIFRSNADGVYSTLSSYRIDSSSVKYCSGTGLYYFGLYATACDLIIRYDTLDYNMSGIELSGGGPGSCSDASLTSAIIYRNTFRNNTSGAISMNGGNTNLQMSENYFENNSGSTTAFLESENYIIECNKFINNQSPQSVLTVGTGKYIAYVMNNVFDGNISSGGSSGSIVFISEPNAFYNTIYFDNNRIKNNLVINGSTCKFKGRIGSNISTKFKIEHNIFDNNQATNNIHLSAYMIPDFDMHVANISNNNFLNSNSTYEIYNDIPFGSPNIDADSNYWGTTNIQQIDSVIYDFFDYANQSVVFYSPILASPATIDTTCSPIGKPAGIVNGVEANNGYSIIFPNPFTTQATITFGKEIYNATFRLYNLFGQLVQQKNNIMAKKLFLPAKTSAAGFMFLK